MGHRWLVDRTHRAQHVPRQVVEGVPGGELGLALRGLGGGAGLAQGGVEVARKACEDGAEPAFRMPCLEVIMDCKMMNDGYNRTCQDQVYRSAELASAKWSSRRIHY